MAYVSAVCACSRACLASLGRFRSFSAPRQASLFAPLCFLGRGGRRAEMADGLAHRSTRGPGASKLSKVTAEAQAKDCKGSGTSCLFTWLPWRQSHRFWFTVTPFPQPFLALRLEHIISTYSAHRKASCLALSNRSKRMQLLWPQKGVSSSASKTWQIWVRSCM